MNRIFSVLIVAIFCCLSTLSQVPQKVKYQGVARDLAGLPIVNQNISIKVSILQSSPSGTPVYVESFATATNALGLFSISIGTGNIISGNFAAISWGQSDYFQQVEMDPTGGSAYVFVGVSQLLSVPYALYSENAGNCGFTNMQVFTSPGNFIIPDNIKKIMVEVWGGGGGGGHNTFPSRECGGGGGGYGKGIFAVTPGTNYLVTIGYGGIGTISNGGNGGTSALGSLISANGGGGGQPNGGYGGTSSAPFNIMGQDSYLQSGSAVTGGDSPNGGTGGQYGIDGRQPGGGGGGGYGLPVYYPGGDGGQGRVVVWW